MAYFNELPNLDVESRLPDKSSREDFIRIKNIWRRAKIREDFANAVGAFVFYDIQDGERPDQIAEKAYGDPELDWVILVSNNITNLVDQWPLDNNSLYKYLLDKYGSDEELQKIHHIETVEQRENFRRLVVPAGLIVDLPNVETIKTESNKNKYTLESYPIIDANNKVSINLIQFLEITSRDNSIENSKIVLSDNQEKITNLKVYRRNGSISNIEIKNNLENSWPYSWGGNLSLNTRSETIQLEIEDDVFNDTFIEVSNNLFNIFTDLTTDKPTIEFVYISQETIGLNPKPGITVKFERSGFNTPILNQENQSIINYQNTNPITNYEYEVKKNEDKRRILILKKEFLGVFISDLRSIMKYDKSSQFIDQTNRRV